MAYLTAMFIPFAVCSCSGDDESPLVVTPASVSMHYDETQQLSAEGATSWLTNDEFVAKVDSKGLVTARHIGNTQIVVSDGKRTATCEVTVTPEYSLYDDPILDWGASKSSIQSKEKHEKGTSSDSNILVYNYTFGNNVCVMGYTFENGKLKSVTAMMDNSLYLRTGYYLIERFQPVAATKDYDYVFVDAMETNKVKTIVYFALYKSGSKTYTTVIYGDYAAYSSKTRSANDEDVQKQMSEMVSSLENM